MARIRTVKPELLTHEQLFELEKLTGYPIRIAFVGLFTCCDREGRFKWKPRELKLSCLPFDEIDFSHVLDALMTAGFIQKHLVDGSFYGLIPSWKKHQHINNRESESDLPNLDETTLVSITCKPVDDASTTRLEGKGREGKGREGEKHASASPPFDPKTELAKHGVSDQIIIDWLALRKAKKAIVTLTALQQIIKQADKASLPLEQALAISCRRGWIGFEASWLKPEDMNGAAPIRKDWE